MNNCVELEAGEQGLGYIRSCLASGKRLGRQLSTLLDREPGQVTALLPGDVDLERASELVSEFRMKYGGIGSSTGGALACMAKIAQEFLAEASNHVCIIEDMMVQREDSGLSSLDLPILFLDSDVYWFLSSEHQGDWTTIRGVLSAQDSSRVTGLLTSWPIGRTPLAHRGEITLEDVNILASRARIITIHAYDGEGYVIWRRT